MSSIGNSLASSAAQFFSLLSGSASNTNTSSSASAASSTQDGTPGISQFARLLKKLEGLSQTDPTKFKSLTAQIASQLKTAAAGATGSQAQFLTNLSNQFTQASTDGNISALQPQQSSQSSGGHHHHHHHGGGAYSSSSSSDSTSDTQSVLQTIFSEVQSA